MPLPLIVGAGALLGAVGVGSFLKSGGGSGSAIGSGFLEVGTKKEYKTTEKSNVYLPIYSPTTTNTKTYQPVYTYAPQYQISSPYASMVSKKQIQPTVSPTVSPIISPQVIPIQTGGSGSKGGTNLWEEIKPMLLLAGIGYGAYLLLK